MEQHKAEIARTLDKLVGSRFFKGSAVFLFGHCNATEEVANYLLKQGVVPAAILDNNISKQGMFYRDIPVVAPEIIIDDESENSVVLIATRFYAEMAAQLERSGYKGRIVQVVEYNSFAEFSLTPETIKRRTERMLRGKKTLAGIRRMYPTQHFVICPNCALGDVYWAMAFLPHYCNKHNIQETTVVVIGDACAQTAELFGAGKPVVLSETQMDELVQAIIFTREDNCIIASHEWPYTNNIAKYLDNHFLSFIDYYCIIVYGLSGETQPSVPTRLEAYTDTAGMKRGKSVILSPYAKSVVEQPAEFWENIALGYSSQGYKVYTNVSGNEIPIPGTELLRIPISQAINAAEYAGVFVGVRSGLCDVLYSADCRKIAVFPDCFYSTTPHKAADFFALPGWETIIV